MQQSESLLLSGMSLVAGSDWSCEIATNLGALLSHFEAKNHRIPVGSPIPIGDGDGDVIRFPDGDGDVIRFPDGDGDGDGDGDEVEKRGWGWSRYDHKKPEFELEESKMESNGSFRGDLERLHADLPKLETSLKCCLGSCGAETYLEPKEEMWSFCNQVVSLDMLMTYLVASQTLDRAGSYVMHGAHFTQGMIPSIPIGGSISPEGFLPSILLVVNHALLSDPLSSGLCWWLPINFEASRQ
ncbi:hypothetical protein Tco_1165421 [Tanacetum coccineum]